jgi:uncharacterized SAM-binding protein YcdF (DUF218 family)
MGLSLAFRHVVGILAAPLVLATLGGLLGAILRALGRPRAAARCWWVGAGILYLSATAPVADGLLLPLERRYPPIGDHQALPRVQDVVVLGSGYAPRRGLPVTAALECDGLARIAEGVMLLRRIPGARLVVSGGPSGHGVSSATGYSRFAIAMGVDPSAIVTLDRSDNTAAEAAAISRALGRQPFLLVTSAYHMPRAMRLLTRAGADPIPAPTGQRGPAHLDFGFRAWIPSTSSLRKTERAVHEYLGLLAPG